jgi:hypothetical protein
MNFVNGCLSSVNGMHSNVISLVALLGDPGTNIFVPSTGSVDSTTAILTDNEVPYLRVSGVFPNTGDTGPTVDRVVIFVINLVQNAPLLLTTKMAMQIVRKLI